jgi:predicted AAA+ superfamily ATPase
MISRPRWLARIESCWLERPIIWLTAPRRVGKTTLAKSIPKTTYIDCEIPSLRRDADDTESFLQRHAGHRLILDEIHRLADPSNLLKLAADHFPGTQILATGSSTLAASARFRDTLAGRKRTIHLQPVLVEELPDFHATLEKRLLHGGLPAQLLAPEPLEADFREWIEAYWARDILELFTVGKRHAFLKFLELLWLQSGGLCELTHLATPCQASRQTLSNYLDILAATGVIRILRPYAKNPSREIIAQPKIYAFDTGFVCHIRGHSQLRPDDMGTLWEHLVLDTLHTHLPIEEIHYWRDKQKHEIDFIWAPRGTPPVAIQCKWRATTHDPADFQPFTHLHPQSTRWLIAADRTGWITRSHKNLPYTEAGLDALPALISSHCKSQHATP